MLRVRHRELLLRRDLSNLCQTVHVLTARLLHHFTKPTLTQHLRQHGKVIRNDGGVVIESFFCDAISLFYVRHREPLLRRDLSNLYQTVHVLTTRLLHHFAISTLTQHLRQHGKVIRNDGGVVIASLFCDAISNLYQTAHVLTARLLHHFAITTLTQHLRQHGKVIRNDGGVVIASLFCDAISLLYTRHQKPSGVVATHASPQLRLHLFPLCKIRSKQKSKPKTTPLIPPIIARQNTKSLDVTHTRC